MQNNTKITFNDSIKLIFADVDETIADVYKPAVPEMIIELEKLLSEGKLLFLMTGAGLKSIEERIASRIKTELRKNMLIAHCNGAEVWGHDPDGKIHEKPYYSLYDEQLTDEQKKEFRNIVNQLLQEFKLKTFPTMPKVEFKEVSKEDPLSIMLADRGPQITFEVVNAFDLNTDQVDALEIKVPLTNGAYDLRIPILERADQLFHERNVPISSRLGGTCALDFTVKGVSKTTAVTWFLHNESLLSSFGLHKDMLLQNPQYMEVWGDKFSTVTGGPDRHISEGLPKEVQSIDFRQEDPRELPEGYNIVIWDGKKHLHEGLLEYLQSRNK